MLLWHQQQPSRLMLICPVQPGKPVPELSETLTQYTILTVLKFPTGTPNFPSQTSSLALGSNFTENPANS